MTRWTILAAYALLAASTQLLWLTFAAVDTKSAAAMHVSVALVGDLAAVFPLVYIVLALPTGRWLDRAFRQALGAGAAITAAGALLRLAAPTSFGWQLAGQFVIATGQPLVLNGINKIAVRYFAPRERPTAISIGTAALFVGILAAVLMAAPIFNSGGLSLLLDAQAAVAVVAAVFMLSALRIPARFSDDTTAATSLRWLVEDRFMWLLAGLVFVGMGVYNAVATWLQPILAAFGQGDAAGGLIAVLTFAGIAGAAVIPTPASRSGRRRTVLLVALLVTAGSMALIALLRNSVLLGASMFAAGFVLLAALPVVLDWSDVHAGAERQGSAVGFLMMAGNLGGLVLVLAVQAALGNPYLAVAVLTAIPLLGLPLVLRLPARTAAA